MERAEIRGEFAGPGAVGQQIVQGKGLHWEISFPFY